MNSITLKRLFNKLDIEIQTFVRTSTHIDTDSYFFLEQRMKEISQTVLSKEEKIELCAWVAGRLQELSRARALSEQRKFSALEWLMGWLRG